MATSSSASTEEPSDADLLAAAAHLEVAGESDIVMNGFTFVVLFSEYCCALYNMFCDSVLSAFR